MNKHKYRVQYILHNLSVKLFGIRSYFLGKVSTRDVIRRALDFMITLEATSCGKSVDEVKNRRLPQGVDEFC